jgi:hypothetical protein
MAAECRWTDWVPTLGGRSVRPILDRMDYALTQVRGRLTRCMNLEPQQLGESHGFSGEGNF